MSLKEASRIDAVVQKWKSVIGALGGPLIGTQGSLVHTLPGEAGDYVSHEETACACRSCRGERRLRSLAQQSPEIALAHINRHASKSSARPFPVGLSFVSCPLRREDDARKPFPGPERSEGPYGPAGRAVVSPGGLAGAEAPAVLGGACLRAT